MVPIDVTCNGVMRGSKCNIAKLRRIGPAMFNWSRVWFAPLRLASAMVRSSSTQQSTQGCKVHSLGRGAQGVMANRRYAERCKCE
mmetsp:Transcript_103812/g.206353  ORF Transcript_103812/g.206353 Transcript_103812/m.206353 type:complete len:85 (-) Transcript_103812:86-340(-)